MVRGRVGAMDSMISISFTLVWVVNTCLEPEVDRS